MPPELLPFASDAVGNRFCLVMDDEGTDPEKLPVVYWMYETTLAVPIASCFDRFLDWIGLVSEIYVRRGTDEIYSRVDHEEIVLPTLDALGVKRDFFALTTSVFARGQPAPRHDARRPRCGGQSPCCGTPRAGG